MNLSSTILAVAYFTVALSGCASFVESEVTVFHHFGETPPAKTYALVPLNVQGNGPGYEAYAALVRQALRKYRYREVTGEESPDVVVAFGYGIDSGTGKLVSIPSYGQPGIPSLPPPGAFRSHGSYGAYAGITNLKPPFRMPGSSAISVTEYKRSLWLYIYDAKSIGTERLEVLYAGIVESAGSSSELSQVVPAMIDALFKTFPGASGETRREVISTVRDRG